MTPLSFLKDILPTNGVYCLTSIKNGIPKQKFYDNIADAAPYIKSELANKANIYYAMASFVNKGSRKQDNVAFIKSYWIDLDCGDGTAYETIIEGQTALNKFAVSVDLPAPTIVCSGYGLHAYWTLTDNISRQQWAENATKLTLLAAAAGLIIKDPQCSRDAVRILRVPNTLNFKVADSPVRTFIAQSGVTIDYEDFTATINDACNLYEVSPTNPVIKSNIPLDATTKALIQSTTSNFAKILSLGVDGCKHIHNSYIDQANTPEPHWRAALSIAQVCEDRIIAIHKISENHPNYTPQETEEKAEATKGPYTCATMEGVCGSCDGCPNKGKITSPIQLGRVFLRSEPNKILAPAVIELVTTDTGSIETKEVIKELTTPTLSWPYDRKEGGGIIKEGDKKILSDGTTVKGEEVLVYEYDLYLVKRLYDMEQGESYLCHLHLPMDGIREFILPLCMLQAPDKLRDVLSKHGVAAGKTKMELIMGYLIHSAKEIQRMVVADVSRTQFGWVDNDTGFIVGNREIRAESTTYSPTSTTTANVVQFYQQKGSLDEWKIPLAVYENEGYELQAFCVASSLGSVLLKFVNSKVKGIIINLVNSKTGTGKSTVLEVINSFWGHPMDCMLLAKDSIASVLHRTGVLCNIPVTVDEITNIKPTECSDMIYSHSQGRARNRMQGAANIERTNSTYWSSIMVTTANSSMADKTRMQKMTNEAENVRMMEFTIDVPGDLSLQESNAIFGKLNNNYGIAGELFIRFVLNNKDKVTQLLEVVKKDVESKMAPKSSERMWVAAISANITAMYIAKSIKLFNYDVDRVMNVVYAELLQTRATIEDNRFTHDEILGTYINANVGNIIIASDGEGDIKTPTPIIRDARFKVVGRYETMTEMLLLAKKDFMIFCVENQLSVKELEASFKASNNYLGIKKARLLTGTGIRSEGVDCYQFKMSIDLRQQDADNS